jgi:hypothetical protein
MDYFGDVPDIIEKNNLGSDLFDFLIGSDQRKPQHLHLMDLFFI